MILQSKHPEHKSASSKSCIRFDAEKTPLLESKPRSSLIYW